MGPCEFWILNVIPCNPEDSGMGLGKQGEIQPSNLAEQMQPIVSSCFLTLRGPTACEPQGCEGTLVNLIQGQWFPL